MKNFQDVLYYRYLRIEIIVNTCNLKSNPETFYTFKRHNMFVVSNCQPATELYGSLEIKLYTSSENLERSGTLEQRLQLLGIKNSIVQEKLGIKTPFGIICSSNFLSLTDSWKFRSFP